MSTSSYRALFQNQAYVRLFVAGLGSVLGSAIAGVCLVWIVAVRTGSALDVAFLAGGFLAAAIPLSTLGGTLVDRYDRRRLMILADVARAATMVVVVVDLSVQGLNLSVLIAANFVLGAFTVLFNPAEQALVPALVGAAEVADANGLVRSSRSTVQFVGIAIAGLRIVSVGPVLGVASNAVSFGVSALLLTGMRTPALPPRPERHGYLADLRSGFVWLWAARGFLQITISATFFNFCASLIGTFLVFYATIVLHGSALDFAALLAAEVAGGSIGALLVGRLGAARYAGRAWVVPYGIASGAVALALPLAPAVPIAIVALFALGAFGGFAGTAWLTASQLLVPTEYQGRYFGVDQLGSIAILPVAQIGGALLIASYGVSETYLLAAVLWVVAGAIFLVPRAMWNLGVPTSSGDRNRPVPSATEGAHVPPGNDRGA